MKTMFYPKLALDSIRKNKRLYSPYILTCIGMVMMFYIIHFLASSPLLNNLPGGESGATMLNLGAWVVALFAAIFLLYTNSFLMGRRKKEFGLYNVLGMDKRNLSKVLAWETLILFAVSVVIGLFGGIALSKLAELGLMYAIRGDVTYNFTINGKSVLITALLFVLIFALIYAKNSVQILRMSTVSLLKSENAGEKPPKANYLLGIVGLILLAAAYYLAVSIKSPLLALSWFFIAVCMVIVATYLLFISGSVVMCRLLQKNKKYYYKKQHFVSVSSMAYRMKRNGAGLASICILSTMVLVMLVGSASLFFGAEDSLRTRYPRDIAIYFDCLNDSTNKNYTEDNGDALMKEIRSVVASGNFEPKNEELYSSAMVVGMLNGEKMELDYRTVNGADFNSMDKVCNFRFIPLADYNRCMGTNETLKENEALMCCVRYTYEEPTIVLNEDTQWVIKKQLSKIMGSGDAAMDIIPTVFLVVPDLNGVIAPVNSEMGEYLRDDQLMEQKLYYGFDTSLSSEEEMALAKEIPERIKQTDINRKANFYNFYVECRENERADFYGTYGGIFFLGILLSIVFLFATVLIIYYKQISEGYEDEGRFEIMQKVGMSRSDIRKSVNNQILTVFFLPLVMAVLHLGFAFPMIKKLLMLFNLHNMTLILAVTAVTVLVFAVLYACIYKLTANAYYTIVSTKKDDN